MIKFLLACFIIMFLYGIVLGNAAIGVFALFCGVCLYYFDKKMSGYQLVWEKSPDAAKAPLGTKQMLDKNDCECSGEFCPHRF